MKKTKMRNIIRSQKKVSYTITIVFILSALLMHPAQAWMCESMDLQYFLEPTVHGRYIDQPAYAPHDSPEDYATAYAFQIGEVIVMIKTCPDVTQEERDVIPKAIKAAKAAYIDAKVNEPVEKMIDGGQKSQTILDKKYKDLACLHLQNWVDGLKPTINALKPETN